MTTNNSINANSTTPLPMVDGGTGVNAVTTAPAATAFAGWDANKNLTANNHIEAYTTTATSASPVALLVGSTFQQFFTGSTAQTVTLPVANTLVLGQSFLIVNNSTAIVTVQSSGSNTITAMAASTQAVFTCILASGTTAASWSSDYAANVVGVTSVVKQTFTANGTYTPTLGMLYCIIECWGAGGGGAGQPSAGAGTLNVGGGGGAGGYSRTVATAATVGASKAVTCSSTGGAGGSAGANNGIAGGNTSVGSICIANGGSGGIAAGAAGGTGGAAGTGDLTATGATGKGGCSVPIATTVILVGDGASSPIGGGGAGGYSGGTGAAATGYASGGASGVSQNGGAAAAGGAGSPGFVFITEYV